MSHLSQSVQKFHDDFVFDSCKTQGTFVTKALTTTAQVQNLFTYFYCLNKKLGCLDDLQNETI